MNTFDSHVQSLSGPIVVLGASGFIGANLFKKILAVRKDVFAIVRIEKNWRLLEIDDEFIIAADINDFSATKNLIEKIQPKTVFDCIAYGAYSFEENTNLIYQTNFTSVINLVEQLQHTDIVAYIHAGSSSEYGSNCVKPKEDSICKPNSAYSVSKIAAANYLNFMGKHKNFPCVNLRLYSVYGPLEDTSRLLPNLLNHVLHRKLPKFVNPNISRDFVYVDDVCNAFVLAASKMNPDIYGEDFNIGTGVKTTIFDLVSKVKHKFDIPHEPEFGAMESRVWDLTEWYANPTKAFDILNWKAIISLDDGIDMMSQWVKKLSLEEITKSSKINQEKQKRSVTAVIACYKDVEAIPIMYQRLTDTFVRLGIDYEIVFVNDCSPDNSEEVIRGISLGDSKVIGISHSRNFGSQMAFRSGMEISTKDAVVLLDGDLQDPPELISEFYEKWESGFDVVYGRRVKREMSWISGLMYKLFYRIFAIFSYIKIPLDAGDFSLLDKRVVTWILNCPERDLFVRGIRAYVGFRQIGVNYIRPERMFGRSTNSFLKNIEWAKKGIFSFSNTPLTILTSLGILSFLGSVILALTVALLRIFMPDIAPKGITTLLITILMFGSLNLFAIGLVGEYISKIMIEVKGRPRLIRSSLIRNGEVSKLLPDSKEFGLK